MFCLPWGVWRLSALSVSVKAATAEPVSAQHVWAEAERTADSGTASPLHVTHTESNQEWLNQSQTEGGQGSQIDDRAGEYIQM